MTRLVRGSDGTVAADPNGKASGRGTYICDNPDCRQPERLAQSVKRALGASPAPGSLQFEEKHAPT